jgi:lipopolysaccharide export system permease protein
MTGVGRLERYVLFRFTAAVGVALAVVAAVVLLVQFVDLTRQVGARSDADAGAIFGLTLLSAPPLILTLLPFIFLFGGIGAYVGLNRSSELVAMRAAGVSAWRFILPAAAAAFVVGWATVAALNPLAALSSTRFQDQRARLMENYLGDQPSEVWLRQGDGASQIVIHAKARDVVAGSVRLLGVSLFVYRKGASGFLEFSRRLESAEAQLQPGAWRLRGVREVTAGGTAVHSDSMSLSTNLDSRGAMESFASPDGIGFWDLPSAIRATEQAGFPASGYRLRFHQLLATPLLFVAMSVLGAAFSLRMARMGGLAGLAGLGVALGFLMFFFSQFSGAMSSADIIPEFAAGWAPAVVGLLSGLTLLCYTEDG